METIGLRELNQNPSKAVARSGASLVVTDRGQPVLRMIPETEHPSTLQRMISTGEVRAPVDIGVPDAYIELAPELHSVSELLIADRDRERNR